MQKGTLIPMLITLAAYCLLMFAFARDVVEEHEVHKIKQHASALQKKIHEKVMQAKLEQSLAHQH